MMFFQPLVETLKKRPLWALLSLFIVSRLLLILWGIQGISHYEELEQGYIAVEFLSGLRGKLIDYQVDSYTGGTLFMGLLAVPFFLLFGPTLFSLKLLALCIGVASFMLVYKILFRFFGKRTAVITCLLWVFCPPILYSTALMALGSHERRLPLFIIIYCLLMYFAEHKPQCKQKYLIFMGLSWGFAFSVSFINAIAAIVCLVTLALFSQHPRKLRDWLLLAASTAAGAGYWFWYNINQKWAGVQFLAEATIFTDGLTLKERFLNLGIDFMNLILHFFPNALSFQNWGPFPGKYLNYIYCGALGLFVLPGILRTFHSHKLQEAFSSTPQPRHVLKMFLAVYMLLFPVFYCLSENKIYSVERDAFNYRYLIPFYTVIFLYFSVMLAELRHKKKILAFFLFFGIVSQVQMIWGQPYGEVFQKPGFKSGLRSYIWNHSPKQFRNFEEFESLSPRFSQYELKQIANQDFFWNLGTPPEIVAEVLKIENEAFRRYFFLRWASKLSLAHELEDLQTTNLQGKIIPPPYQRFFYIGAAKALNFAEWKDMNSVLSFVRNPELPYRNVFFFYWGKSLFNLYRNGYESRADFIKKMDFVSRLPPKEKIWIYRGMGYSFFRSFQPEKIFAVNLSLIKGLIPEEAVPELYWGIGWYLGRRYFDYPQKVLEKIADFPEEQQLRLRAGYEAFQGESSEMDTV